MKMNQNSEENLAEFDYEDSQKLIAFGVETVRIAESYQAARERFGQYTGVLKLHLAGAYRDKEIETKHSEDKAYLILSGKNEVVRTSIVAKTNCENQYKGLERVLDARQAVISLAQSLIKNKLRST